MTTILRQTLLAVEMGTLETPPEDSLPGRRSGVKCSGMPALQFGAALLDRRKRKGAAGREVTWANPPNLTFVQFWAELTQANPNCSWIYLR